MITIHQHLRLTFLEEEIKEKNESKYLERENTETQPERSWTLALKKKKNLSDDNIPILS